MTDMTDDELDEARAREAKRLVDPSSPWRGDGYAVENMIREAARLARTGWVPVDPDLVAVREIVAKVYAGQEADLTALAVMQGRDDESHSVICALAAFKAGRAVGR